MQLRYAIQYWHVPFLNPFQKGDLFKATPPAWATWKSNDHYLSDAFYTKKSSASLLAVYKWIATDPITVDGSSDLAPYAQVELVGLAIGLAFQALWIAQFPENFSDVPTQVIESPYPFSEYEQLSHNVEDLISGYVEPYGLL